MIFSFKVLIQKVAVLRKISSPGGNFLYPSIFKLQKVLHTSTWKVQTFSKYLQHLTTMEKLDNRVGLNSVDIVWEGTDLSHIVHLLK